MFRESWRTQLKAAARERDVLAVVRAFLGEWSKAEIAALPRGAWPSRTGSTADVVSHSVVLAGLHGRFEGDAAQLKLLQELLLFFTQAAVRAVRLREAASAADCPPAKRRKAPARRKSHARRRAAQRPR